MVTFELLPESWALITGDTARTIHRLRGLTIGADEWQALQRAPLVDGKHVVTCGESAAATLLEWFERSFEVARDSQDLFGEPSTVLSGCRRASAAIRAALASGRPPGPLVDHRGP
jgi:hypothetical protein